MIRLTRLRNANPLYLNPDHIERLDSHHETTVHLFNGNEYVVTETADEIVRLVNEQRAHLLALASRLELEVPGHPMALGAVGAAADDDAAAADDAAADADTDDDAGADVAIEVEA